MLKKQINNTALRQLCAFSNNQQVISPLMKNQVKNERKKKQHSETMRLGSNENVQRKRSEQREILYISTLRMSEMKQSRCKRKYIGQKLLQYMEQILYRFDKLLCCAFCFECVPVFILHSGHFVPGSIPYIFRFLAENKSQPKYRVQCSRSQTWTHNMWTC